MEDYTQFLKRAHIQQLRSFLIEGEEFGSWMEEDHRSYEQRRREEERPIWKLLETTFSEEEIDNAVEKLSRAISVNQEMYMELGMKAGAILVLDLLREHL